MIFLIFILGILKINNCAFNVEIFKGFCTFDWMTFILKPYIFRVVAGNERYKGPKDLPKPLKELGGGVQITLNFYKENLNFELKPIKIKLF